MSLYQKYRPNNFEDVVGRDFIIQTLKNSIRDDNINHAYIFHGTRGTGKTTIARIMARSVNCTGEDKPCLECDNCKMFTADKTPDIIEMDGASNRGIDDIRGIIDHSQYMPHYSKYKVYIIDEVHMLTKEAFNALLKTLEEPPKHIIFILATTEINKVPDTILSRCERYDFTKLSNEQIINRLKYIGDKENIKYEEEALNIIADRASGGMRDAIMLFEQFSQGGILTKELIEKNLGLISENILQEFIKTIVSGDYIKFSEIFQSLQKNSININVIIEQLSPILLELMKSNIKSLEFNKYYSLLIALDNIYKKIKYTSSPLLIFEGILLNELFKNEGLENKIVDLDNSNKIEKKQDINKDINIKTENTQEIKDKTNEEVIIEIEDVPLNIPKEKSKNKEDKEDKIENDIINTDKNIETNGEFNKEEFIANIKSIKGGGLASIAVSKADLRLDGDILHIKPVNSFQKNNLVKAEIVLNEAIKQIDNNLSIKII